MKNIELLQVERLLIKLKSFFTPSFLKTLKFELLNSFRTNSRLLFAYSVILFLLFSQEDFILALFDKYVLILPEFKTTLLSSLFFLTSLVYVIYRFWVLWKNRFVISSSQIILCSVLLIIYSYYRIHNIYIHEYVYFPRNSFIAYLDVISFLLLVFWLITGISYLKNLKAVELKKTQAGITPGEFNGYIEDQPISDSKYDLLDYTKEVTDLAEKLKSIPFGSSCSIGIIASWGSGKSSYLNLLRNCISDDDFIVVKFNPRHSKNAQNIQEDFFRILLSQLKVYGSEFSTLVKDYLKAIGIIDQNKFVSFITDLLSLNNDDDKKSKLNQAIKLLPKRVLVFIEDFDRLLADEIIEVFKLIDGNASLNNIIFLTAYDKVHINKIIDEKYKNENSFFSDKFFAWEISIPLRPYSRIYDYFVSSLFKGISIKIEDREFYESVLKDNYDIIRDFLPTLRDSKRFLNIFFRQYKFIETEVEFEDYFLLSLIKYKYEEEYASLHKGHYITSTIMSVDSECYVKDESLVTKPNSDLVISKLFKQNREKKHRTLNNKNAFDIYFYHSVYRGLKMEELLSLFSLSKIDVSKKINNWIQSEEIIDVLNFLYSRNISTFKTKDDFKGYVEILFYLSSTSVYSTKLFDLILRLMSKQNLIDLSKEYLFEEGEYKLFIEQQLKDNTNKYPYLITQKLSTIFNDRDLFDKIIFNHSDILKISKSNLSAYILSTSILDQFHLELLYSCVESVSKNTHQITLAKDSCKELRDLILKSPDCYIESFVRLGMLSFNPEHNSIACEPFWNQIFNDVADFERFLEQSNVMILEKFQLVKRFWDIYRNNNYSPIVFEGLGIVSDMILNGLINEYGMLEQLFKIQDEITKLKDDTTLINEEKITSCDDLYVRIEQISLFISLNGSIRKEIQEYKTELFLNDL